MSEQDKGPLIIRLCNWVGEAVLALPGLLALQQQGYELHLIGKRWAASLFEAHGWPVHVRPARRADAIAQLRQLRRALVSKDGDFERRPNMVLLTSSFSSALEARLAGLRPVGYGKEGRSLLLAKSIPFVEGLHAADNYWRICVPLLSGSAMRPASLGLQINDQQTLAATTVLAAHGVKHPYAVVCPFSGAADTIGKKLWPEFAALVTALRRRDLPVVMCPGPDEVEEARRDFSEATLLSDLNLGAYAALMARADVVVSNDTGPGHIAAAVGAKLVSVFGPGSTQAWTPIGHGVTVLHPQTRWPTLDEVLSAIDVKADHR
jgi:heptosyltransferase-2